MADVEGKSLEDVISPVVQGKLKLPEGYWLGGSAERVKYWQERALRAESELAEVRRRVGQ